VLTSSAVSSSKDILLRQCFSPPERVIWWVGGGNVIEVNLVHSRDNDIYAAKISEIVELYRKLSRMQRLPSSSPQHVICIP